MQILDHDHPDKVVLGGDVLMMISVVECEACDNMSAAFTSVEIEQGPDRVDRVKLKEETLNEKWVDDYQLEVFPTLIHFSNGNEVTRWGGFFSDGTLSELARQLQELLESHFSSTSTGEAVNTAN